MWMDGWISTIITNLPTTRGGILPATLISAGYHTTSTTSTNRQTKQRPQDPAEREARTQHHSRAFATAAVPVVVPTLAKQR